MSLFLSTHVRKAYAYNIDRFGCRPSGEFSVALLLLIRLILSRRWNLGNQVNYLGMRTAISGPSLMQAASEKSFMRLRPDYRRSSRSTVFSSMSIVASNLSTRMPRLPRIASEIADDLLIIELAKSWHATSRLRRQHLPEFRTLFLPRYACTLNPLLLDEQAFWKIKKSFGRGRLLRSLCFRL